jgi:EAL domain-containing protein (putative c-di-GMP-specific phosphodiesterase class I)
MCRLLDALPTASAPPSEGARVWVKLNKKVGFSAAPSYEVHNRHGAVNLSTVQLRQSELVEDVRGILAVFGGEGGIDLEITESMLMENFDDAGEKLRQLRDFGMEIAIDDFGSGYSSLAYLHRLPISTLKIDRSLVSGMTEESDKTTIVGTIISLAQALKLKVVAEGVETEAQARLLRLLRCDQIQGFLVGCPASAQETTRLIVAHERR